MRMLVGTMDDCRILDSLVANNRMPVWRQELLQVIKQVRTENSIVDRWIDKEGASKSFCIQYDKSLPFLQMMIKPRLVY